MKHSFASVYSLLAKTAEYGVVKIAIPSLQECYVS